MAVVFRKKHPPTLFERGPRKGMVKIEGEEYWEVDGHARDWYEIIDLREWIE